MEAEQERLDAHVLQAGDGRQGVVGVDRREHEVAGQGGAQADLGGLLVAHLADHDDVGVLPQEGPQGRRRTSGPTWALTCTWFIPLNLYSTGSSTVQMLALGSLSRLRQA